VRLIGLIGFPVDSSDCPGAALAGCGYKVAKVNNIDELPVDAAAIFVCGDRPGWLETVCEARAAHGRTFLVVATRLPDYEKWLDALEAGANDYCCTPLDAKQLGWLLRRDAQPPRIETAPVFKPSNVL